GMGSVVPDPRSMPRIARSVDGGQSWTLQESGTTQRLMGVTAGPDGTFFAVGWDGTASVSADGGLTWQATENLTRRNLTEVAFNRLPDLAITGLSFDAECRVQVGLINHGPATLPSEVWDDESALLRITVDEEEWVTEALLSLDPEMVLGAAGGREEGLFGEPVSGDSLSISAVVDADGVISEADEGNNAWTRVMTCPPRPEGTVPAANRNPQ
ncbi:WD40/YVTN/BNR-like repeat-containing protein, partial [Gemmatimonadota bacterium]